MSKWQPIETAPKEQEVLIYDPKQKPSVFTAEYFDGEWQCSVEGRWAPVDEFFGDAGKCPTHWMPLPDPPE